MESKYNSLSLGSLVQEDAPPPTPFFVPVKDRRGEKNKQTKNVIAEHL